MSEKVFLLKTDENDRDCVKYLDLETGAFECGHYFAGLRITGACFSGFESQLSKLDFESFETILTNDELQRLFDFSKQISELGYSIEVGSERYVKGLKIVESISDIIAKLKSEENQVFFEGIKAAEVEYLKEEHDLNDEDIQFIFDNYGLGYRDRSVIGAIFTSIDDCAREEAEGLGYVTEQNERYFDYNAFGEDLLNGETYLELSDGRVAYLMY